MAKKEFYILLNTRNNEIVGLTEDYKLLVKFISKHINLCKHCVVRDIKRKEFDKLMCKYDELYLVEIDDIPMRQKDTITFMKMKEQEEISLFNTLMGLNRLYNWDGIKKKEKDNIQKSILTILKYIDIEDKMIKRSGLSDICNDIDFLNEISNLKYK